MTRKNHAASYGIALVLEAASFYGGFTFLLASLMPPVYRLIGICVCFPLAAFAAWWGGHIRLLAIGEKHYHYMQLFDTLPIRAFLGIILAAIVVAIMVLLGAI
jgi:hypothetical protein